MNAKSCIIVVATIMISVQLADAQTKVPRIGFLAPQSRPAGRVEAFRDGLRDLGYIEGQNVKIDYRGHEDRSQLAGLATELVREKVEVIVTQAGQRFRLKTPRLTCHMFSGLAAIRSRPVLCAASRNPKGT